MDRMLLLSLICFAGARWRLSFWAGILLQCAYLVQRGLALGRLPLLGPRDTLVLFSLSLAAAGVLASCTSALREKGWLRYCAGGAAGGITMAAMLFPPMNRPLPAILDTAWFELHVILAFLAYGLFTVGGMLSAAYLANGFRSYFTTFHKLALTGWCFFSASMITGGIWGYYAWGTYWLWTPKELWTSILWLFYGLVLHVRYSGSPMADRLTAWCGVVGVAVVLFTYLGVSLLMKSSHSF